MVTATEQAMSTVEALRILAARRDHAAWEYLVHAHGPRMFGIAQRITGDAALAEDVCQEALLQMRDRAGTFKPTGGDAERSADAWIAKVTVRTALQLRRQQQRRRKREDAHTRPAAGAAENTANQEAVRVELLKLPDDMRLPLTLKFYGGLDYPELATELNVTEDAARKRVSRGLQRLRERLALLGLILTATQLDQTLSAGEGAATAARISSEQLARWQGLIDSAAVPALAPLPVYVGGMSLMAKLSICAGVVAAVGLFATLATNGADANKATSGAKVLPAEVRGHTALMWFGADANEKELEAAAGAAGLKVHRKYRGLLLLGAGGPMRTEVLEKLPQQQGGLIFNDGVLTSAVPSAKRGKQPIDGAEVRVRWDSGGRWQAPMAADMKTFAQPIAGIEAKIVTPDVEPGGGNPNYIQVRPAKGTTLLEAFLITLEKCAWPESVTYIVPENGKNKQAAVGNADDEKIRAQLKRKVSFEFVDTPLPETLNFLGTLTGITIKIDDNVDKDSVPSINLKVSDMTIDLALDWITKMAELTYSIKDGAIVVHKEGAAAKAPGPVKPKAEKDGF